jgi:FKBP-type peptidyl-prolyl cis-trans isomerase
MKIKLTILLSVIILVFSFEVSAQRKKDNKKSETSEQSIKMATYNDSISYILGHDIGNNLKMNDIQINAEFFNIGVANGLAGNDSLISDELTSAIMVKFQQEMMARREQQQAEQLVLEKAKGAAFLAENKTKPGVIETESGLQYQVITEGSGENPAETDVVEVHYTGKLIDGSVFDSSVDRGEPIKFPLNQVIKGWTEGVKLMKPGAKYTFFIPSELGYGDRSTGPIPAGSTLIFEVELISIEKQ